MNMVMERIIRLAIEVRYLVVAELPNIKKSSLSKFLIDLSEKPSKRCWGKYNNKRPMIEPRIIKFM